MLNYLIIFCIYNKNSLTPPHENRLTLHENQKFHKYHMEKKYLKKSKDHLYSAIPKKLKYENDSMNTKCTCASFTLDYALIFTASLVYDSDLSGSIESQVES